MAKNNKKPISYKNFLHQIKYKIKNKALHRNLLEKF